MRELRNDPMALCTPVKFAAHVPLRPTVPNFLPRQKSFSQPAFIKSFSIINLFLSSIWVGSMEQNYKINMWRNDKNNFKNLAKM